MRASRPIATRIFLVLAGVVVIKYQSGIREEIPDCHGISSLPKKLDHFCKWAVVLRD